jgi:glycosyltransferase involved in cell wall biosynthesis
LNIGIVCPGYPDSPGGVTDHTTRLVRHWSETGRNVLVLGGTAVSPDAVVGEWARAGVGAILIQYVPFLYARRGLSSFPRRMAIAARSAGLRTAVFVHEPWVPPTRLPWLILSPLQRRQLRRIVALCDIVVTPVPAWRERLGGNVSVAYVGSTLGDPDRSVPPGAELPAPAVFSPFAAGLNWDWIVAAAEAVGGDPRLTVIGGDWETARRDPVLRRWADPAWDWRGRLDAAAVLALLARARLVLAPFVGGLTGRRTSALAAASVGARVLSSRGPDFDETLNGGSFTFAGSRDEYAGLARALFRQGDQPQQRRACVAWYDERLSSKHLDRTLLGLVLGSTS